MSERCGHALSVCIPGDFLMGWQVSDQFRHWILQVTWQDVTRQDPDQSSSSSSDLRDVVGDGFSLAPLWASVNPARRRVLGEVAKLLLGLVASSCGI